jgi:hypothetical protein
MRFFFLLAALAVAAEPLMAEEGVFLPWSDFETLYREKIERDVMKRVAAPKRKPQIHSIDEARYSLEVNSEGAQVGVLLSGRILSGQPEPIPLFGGEAIVSAVEQVTGGAVVAAGADNRMAFLPDGEAAEFQVTARLLVKPDEDNGTRVVSLGIPHALQNALDLTLAAELQLVEAPGVADAGGVHRFAACPMLTVRYADRKRLDAAVAVETEKVVDIDTISRIAVQSNRLFITTHFLPARAVPDTLVLIVQEGSNYVSSSLRPSAVSRLEGGRYELHVPHDDRNVFSIELAMDTPADTGQVTLTLPVLQGNNGRQGRFVVEEPEDGEVTVQAVELVSQIPVERLGPGLAKFVGEHRFFMSVPPDGAITLIPKRFQLVRTPSTVLQSQQFFASFEENGNVLSVLVMDVPPEIGPRMRLKAVPEAEVWSLTVNGAPRKVYAGEDGMWLIPLEAGNVSHVELALLRQGPKLGLQGRLEALVPETGLPSRDIRIGVALPARVDLLSIEGQVNPDTGEGWQFPAEFLGKQHFFSRSFYKGEGMTLAVSYKEPVKHTR